VGDVDEDGEEVDEADKMVAVLRWAGVGKMERLRTQARPR